MSSTQRAYTVSGMTCGHCQASVIEEVSEVPGVERVDVDLESRRVVVHGRDLDDAAVAVAVAAAGYEVVS